MRYASALAMMVLLLASPASALEASPHLAGVVERHRSEIARCYAHATEHAIQPPVRLTLRVEIAPDGHVIQASIAPTASAGYALRTCIVDAARTWMFPPQARETRTLETPLMLAP